MLAEINHVKDNVLRLQLENQNLKTMYFTTNHIKANTVFKVFENTKGAIITDILKINGRFYFKKTDDYTEIYTAHANEEIPFDMSDEELETYIDNLDWQKVILVAIT